MQNLSCFRDKQNWIFMQTEKISPGKPATQQKWTSFSRFRFPLCPVFIGDSGEEFHAG